MALRLLISSTILSLSGVATWYAPREYSGLLRCGCEYGKHTPPWVALDDSVFALGWECGDLIRVSYSDGEVLEGLFLDTGFLHAHYVEDFGPERRIVVDVPKRFWHRDDMAVLVRVENLSLRNRLLHGRRAR